MGECIDKADQMLTDVADNDTMVIAMILTTRCLLQTKDAIFDAMADEKFRAFALKEIEHFGECLEQNEHTRRSFETMSRNNIKPVIKTVQFCLKERLFYYSL